MNSAPDPRFVLTPDQLADIRRTFVERVRAGLAADGQEIKALPAWVGAPPRGGLRGEALAVDFGGTNLRVAHVRFRDAGAEVVSASDDCALPLRRTEDPLGADELFGMHADAVLGLNAPKGLPVGYCFSYPFEALPDGDARLLHWTKDVDVPGVEGELVGSMLHAALSSRGLEPGPVRVVNDTVASLLAAAVGGTGDPTRSIGLIVGTGTNTASFFSPERLPKVTATASAAPMAVNLESGNFHPPHRNACDNTVDAQSSDPGIQLFEKAVSGRYLGALMAAARDIDGFDPERGAQAVAELAGAEGPHRDLARSILNRSADFVAALLAGLIDTIGTDTPNAPDVDRITIQAEGGLYWSKGTGYADRVSATLGALVDMDAWTIRRGEHANFIGAASAALAD